ncbi:MAG TPA: hypothetical protein DEB48_03160 [Verrucomicrobiales bacterium]|nr:hypothetical protein [Verrucomicrobiales bacterium]
MQKTFSPQGWLLAALITAGLWIGYANEPSRSAGNLKTSDTKAKQFFVAAKEAKAKSVKLGALPASAKHIPEGATVVISANIGELLEKGGYAEFLKSDIFQDLRGIIENETAQKIMENPAASGIDIYQPVYIYVNMSEPAEEFGDPLISGGLIAPVKDQKALDKALDLATAQTGLPVNKTAEKGFTQLFMQGMPAAVGYSKDVMIAVGTNDPEKLPNITKSLADRMKGKAGLKNKRITTLLRNKYDVAAWMDYEKFMKFAQGMVPGGERGVPEGLDKFTKDTAYTMTMNFEDGMLAADFTAYGNEDLLEEMNLSKGGLDKGLIKLIPENAIMVAAQAVNMEVARDMFNKHLMPLIENELGGELDQIMEQMEEMIGLNLDELMSIPKGDFLAAWEGVEMVEGDFGPQPTPKLLLGMTVENRKNLNKLMNNPQLQGMLPLLATVGLQIAQSETGFFICSKDHADAVNEGKAAKPIKGAHRDLIANNDYAGFFRFAGLAKVIQTFAGEEEQAQMVIDELKQLDEVSFSGDMKGAKQSGNMTLKFKDKKTNGLKQLIDTGQRLYESFSNLGIGIDFQEDELKSLKLAK